MGMDMDMDMVEKDIIQISRKKNLFLQDGKRDLIKAEEVFLGTKEIIICRSLKRDIIHS